VDLEEIQQAIKQEIHILENADKSVPLTPYSFVYHRHFKASIQIPAIRTSEETLMCIL